MVDIENLWDKDNENAVMLNDLANLIYGNTFRQIIFNKYLFVITDEVDDSIPMHGSIKIGKLFNTDGEILIDEDLCYVIPLVKTSKISKDSMNIEAFALVNLDNYEKLICSKTVNNLMGITKLMSQAYSRDTLSLTGLNSPDDFLTIVNNLNRIQVKVLTKSGEIEKAYISETGDINKSELSLVYKDETYSGRFNKNKISILINTKA